MGLSGSYAHALQTEPCQALLTQSLTEAHAGQHEQASLHFRSTIDAAAQTAGLRRKRPCPQSACLVLILPLVQLQVCQSSFTATSGQASSLTQPSGSIARPPVPGRPSSQPDSGQSASGRRALPAVQKQSS
ncbi:hypothetical protein ABBQ32_001594 [Trebouxia sp. C0010 RCD-2024]